MEENKEKIELIKKSFELKQLKRYKEAIELLYKALEFDNIKTDNVEVLSQIGELHILLGNFERALDEFNKALAINKTHRYSNQKCYEIYIKTKQYAKALKIAQTMLEYEKTAQNFYNYIEALIKSNKTQDAIEVFNTLNEDIKLDSDILYLISTIMPDKKELLLQRIISLDSAHLKANLDLAQIAYENKNYEKVIQYCFNIDEDSSMCYYYLAMVEAQRKNYQRAIELITSAIKIDNEEHDLYFDLAKIYIDTCWFDEALMALKKSINLSLIKNENKNLDEKYYLAGWVLIKQNKLSNALLNLNSVKESSKVYNNAQVLIQIINLKNFDLASAKAQLENLYEKEKDNLILLDTLALVYKELKLNVKAVEIYKEALKLYPDSVYYTLELIDLLIDIKDYDFALEKIENFIKVYENCPSIYNSLARIYYRLNRKQEALLALNKYLELDLNKAETHYFKGLILNDLKQFEEAKNSIYNAIKLNPNVAKYYYQMARSYLGLNDYKSALLYSKEAIELDNNELSYKKQAYDISLLIGDKRQIELFKNQLERSEKLFKLNR